jgi:hypothetical protein
MFLLIHIYLGQRDVKGVFYSAHMAKKFVVRVMRREVEWSDPDPDTGIITAYAGDGYLTIEP